MKYDVCLYVRLYYENKIQSSIVAYHHFGSQSIEAGNYIYCTLILQGRTRILSCNKSSLEKILSNFTAKKV